MAIWSKFSGYAGRRDVNKKLKVRAVDRNNESKTSEGRQSNELTEFKFQLWKDPIQYVFITWYIIYIRRWTACFSYILVRPPPWTPRPQKWKEIIPLKRRKTPTYWHGVTCRKSWYFTGVEVKDSKLVFFTWRNSSQWARAASFQSSSTTLRHTTLGRSPVDEWSARQHITLSTDRHPCPGRIRTRNPSKQEAADLRLWPRGQRNQPNLTYTARE